MPMMNSSKPGNILFDQIYKEELFIEPRDQEFPVRRIPRGIIGEVWLKKKPSRDSLDDPIWLPGPGRHRESVLPSLPARDESVPDGDEVGSDIHALAWYAPRAYYPEPSWGIYYDVRAIEWFVNDFYARVIPIFTEITFKEVRKFVWDRISIHEIEHAALEICCAERSATANLRTPEYVEVNAKCRDFSYWNEINATQADTLWGRKTPGLSAGAQSLLPALWARRDRPIPYSLWEQESPETISMFMAPYSVIQEPLLLGEMRKRLGAKANSKFIKIPEYFYIR